MHDVPIDANGDDDYYVSDSFEKKMVILFGVNGSDLSHVYKKK